MVRIADILKRAEPSSKEEKPEKSSPASSAPKPPSSPKEKEAARREEKAQPFAEKAPHSGKGFSFAGLSGKIGVQPAGSQQTPPQPYSRTEETHSKTEEATPGTYVAQAIKGSEASRQQTAEQVYAEALALAQSILDKAQTGDEITGKEINHVLDDVIRELTYENTELLFLACCQVVEEGSTNFLSAKLVNKAILAIEIGIGKKMNRSKLFNLGMAAFLSDLGITHVLDVVTKKEAFDRGGPEWEKIRDIPNKTIEILKRIPDLDQVVITVAQEFRERGGGEGPLGIKDLQKLDEFSKIVAVIDVFEALTHDRPHRPRMLPHEAMKTILEEGGKFEADVLRLLVDQIGVYPVGSWVKLSTKEIAKVVGANPGQPLRPRIKIMFDDKGQPVEEPQLVDLSKSHSVQVLQPIMDEDLKKVVHEGE